MIQSMHAHHALAGIHVAADTWVQGARQRGEKQNSGMWQNHCILVQKNIKIHKIET